MKKYYRGYTALPFDTETEKAIGFTVSNGYFGRGHDSHIWLPKSQVIVGEANEVGNALILIPAWLLDKNNIDFYRINEIRIGNGEDSEIYL